MRMTYSLVSDTETRPTAGMREAIAAAEVGDEQKGEDPSVNALLERVSDLLGKEAALWLPTGTMCNLIAIKVHTRPADVLIADSMSHIVRAESAGIAFSSGVLVEPIESARGVFSPHDLEAALARVQTVPPPYGAPARLVCVEQTNNFAGGTVWSLGDLRVLASRARLEGLALHMDGARLLNACVAAGVSAKLYAGEVDSVWIDFTKGLGAPIGAVLTGTKDFIAEARRYKHIFGGAMRQAGVAAAACLYALDHHIARLAEDHENARHLAEGLSEIEGLQVLTSNPESNMVFFNPTALGISNQEFLARLAEYGVRMGEVRGAIRAVLHLDVCHAGASKRRCWRFERLQAVRAVCDVPSPTACTIDHLISTRREVVLRVTV
jgi:threonine aldolase